MAAKTGATRVRPEELVLLGLVQPSDRADQPPGVKVAGDWQLPYEEGGPAHYNIRVLTTIARAMGCQVPQAFNFIAGQVFYKDQRVEEVRLSGFTIPEGRPGQSVRTVPWHTPVVPKVAVEADGRLTLDPDDVGRCHLSIMAHRPDGADHITVALLWDLQANAEAWAASSQNQEPAATIPPEDLTVVSGPISHSAIRSMWGARTPGLLAHWQKDEDGTPYYLDPQTQVRVQYASPKGTAFLDPTEVDTAWQEVLGLGDSTVATFLICLAKWLADTGGDSHEPQSLIQVSEVLAFRGIKKHHNGGYRLEQKREVYADIMRLNHIWVTSEEEVWRKIGKRSDRKTVRVHSRLLEVALEDEKDLFGREIPFAVRFHPGDWVRLYLGAHHRMTAKLLAPVLAYNARQGVGRMAMRLGIYLTMQWRIRASYGNYNQAWRVRTLLESAFVPVETDARNFTRFREHFERALDRLAADGVVAGWEYRQWREDRVRGWFKEWLDFTVSISPPEAVLEQYANIRPAARRLAGSASRGKRVEIASPSA